jgi:NAD(P)-dependent dehydrogenase (short-subunit alcohol dehydrogenase family)
MSRPSVDLPEVTSLLDFAGRVAVVTGAGAGLGQAIARRFAQAGARVIVHYRSSADGADAVVDAIGASHAVAVQADLSEDDGAAALIARSVEAFGRVDVLVNNAGWYPLNRLLDMTAAEWDAVIVANLRSAFLCTQAFARRVSTQAGGGAIVNVTSIEAENPAPMHSHYTAAKAGLAMLTRAAAGELGALGIRVNAIAPGLIWREGIEQAWPDGVQRWLRSAPLGRLGLPEDVADACLFLASPGARWITGASLTVDGGVMTHQIF